MIMSNERIIIFCVKVYKMDKLFDTKMFENFAQFEFWVSKMTVPLHKREKTYKDFINKLKIYEVYINTGEMKLLSTYHFEDGKFKYKKYEY